MAKKISAVFYCEEKDRQHCKEVMDLLKDIQELSDDDKLITYLRCTLLDYKKEKTSAQTDVFNG